MGDSFFLKNQLLKYKKNLGVVPVRGIFGKIKSVYVVYEDFDGSIKYYDHPQNKQSTLNMKVFMPVVILLMTFIATLIIDNIIGFDSVIEFALYLIVINLILNVSYVVFTVRKAKRKFHQEL